MRYPIHPCQTVTTAARARVIAAMHSATSTTVDTRDHARQGLADVYPGFHGLTPSPRRCEAAGGRHGFLRYPTEEAAPAADAPRTMKFINASVAVAAASRGKSVTGNMNDVLHGDHPSRGEISSAQAVIPKS